jgi:hypothetical protein
MRAAWILEAFIDVDTSSTQLKKSWSANTFFVNAFGIVDAIEITAA